MAFMKGEYNMATTTMTERLMNALVKGHSLTTQQAISRFGFASPESVRSAVNRLRKVYGLKVESNETVDKRGNVKYKYSIG
jgi:hypothetical protein